MENISLTDDDFEGVEPKPEVILSSEFDNLVVVGFLALAKSEGMPKTDVIQELQQFKNREVVVAADSDKEREERDKSTDHQPSLPNPGGFINFPKRKRSTTGMIAKPPPSIVSPLSPIDKEPKLEELVMLKREECVGIDVEVRKTEKARRKKRIRSDIGCSNGENTKRMKKMKKKKKKMESGPDPPPDLPQNFREKIEGLNGCDLNLVIQKLLTKSDVDDKKYRMSIPIRKIKCEFLRGEEKKLLDSREDKKIKVMDVELIEPSCERLTTLSLRKWEMKKKKGKTSQIYNLVNKNWYNRVVVHNGLLEEMVVQLYAFRVEGKLHFALVKVDDVGGGDGSGVGGGGGDGGDVGGECGIGSSSRGRSRGSDEGAAHDRKEYSGQSI